MKNQSGMLVRVNKDEFQEVIVGKEFDRMLTDAYISNKLEFRKALQNVFVAAGSYNKSFIFYNFGYKDSIYVKNLSLNIDYRFPVYGVRSVKQIVEDAERLRMTKMASMYSASAEEMTGPHFFSHLFGTEYLAGDECMTTDRNCLQDKLDQGCRQIELAVPFEKRKDLCCAMEKLWSMQEKDPYTRLIFLMQDPEKESLEFLKYLYMLMPPRLRCDIGFLTNASVADIDMIANYNLPIRILTMTKANLERVKVLDSNVYHIYDLTRKELYTYDAEKMSLLEQLVSSVSKTQDICFDYAEQFVMREKRSVPSFEIYGEVVKKLFSDDLLWWNRDKIERLEEIPELWNAREKMMEVRELREKAIYAVQTRFQNVRDIQRQLIRKIRSKEEDDRKIITFLKEQLFFEGEIGAVSDLLEELEQEKAAMEDACRNEIAMLQEKQAEEVWKLEDKQTAEVQQIREDHTKAIERFRIETAETIDRLKKNHDSEMEQLLSSHNAEMLSVNQKVDRLKCKVDEKDSEIRKQKDQLDIQTKTYREETVRFETELESAKKKVSSLEKKIQDNNLDTLIKERDEAKDGKKKAEKKRRLASVGRTIFAITTILFLATSGGLGYIGLHLYNEQEELIKQNDTLRAEKDAEIETMDETWTNKINVLEEDKKNLADEVTAQSEKITDLESKIKEMEEEARKAEEEMRSKEMENQVFGIDAADVSVEVSEEGYLVFNGESLSWR